MRRILSRHAGAPQTPGRRPARAGARKVAPKGLPDYDSVTSRAGTSVIGTVLCCYATFGPVSSRGLALARTTTRGPRRAPLEASRDQA